MKRKLSQHGAWGQELDQRAREALATRFSEYGEDTFDFSVCQRPNGSYYGIAAGKRCIKGRGPLNRTSILKDLATKRVPREMLGKLARIKDDKEFSKVATALAGDRRKMTGGPAIAPVTKAPTSLRDQQMPRGGAEAAAKRREATAGKLERVKQLREAQKRRQEAAKEQKAAKAEAEKPTKKAKDKKAEDAGIKARKENKQAATSEPKTRYEKLLTEAGITAKTVTPAELQKRVQALELFEKIRGPEETERLAANLGTLVTSMANRKATTMSVEEVKKLQDSAIQKKLLDGFKDPSSLIGGSNSIIKFKDVSDDEFNAAWAMLSPKMRKSFENCGKPAGKAWQGTDKDGNPINGGNGNPERGRELFRLWLRQGGKCAYTGLPLTWDFSDLEHIKPMGQVGVKAENPNNWLWVRRSVNQLKSEYDMDYLFTGGASSSKKGGWKGVNAIKDYDAHQREFDKAQGKAAGKDAWRDRAASSSFMGEYLGNRRAVIDAFSQAGHIKYVAMALGNAPIDGYDSKLNFPQEQSRNGQRNAAKNLLDPRVTFSGGSVNGKMQVGLWIAENYPDFPPRVQNRVKEIYNDVRLELKSMENPNLQTSGAFAKEFAERVNGYLASEGL